MEKCKLIVQGYGISELIINNKYEKIIRNNIELYQDKYINLDYKKTLKSKMPIDEANYIIHQIDNRLQQIDKFTIDPNVVNNTHRDNNSINYIHSSKDSQKYIRVYFSGKRIPMDGILRRKREYILLIIPENTNELSIIHEIAYRNYLYNEHDFVQMNIKDFHNINITQEGEFKQIETHKILDRVKNDINNHSREIQKDKKNILHPSILMGLYRIEKSIEHYVDKLGLPII